MSSDLLPPAPITDQRPKLEPVVPLNVQTLAYIGGAVAVLAIVLLTSRSDTIARPPGMTATEPPLVDLATVEGYQEQLQRADVAPPVKVVDLTTPELQAARPSYVDSGYSSRADTVADPIAEDLKRREYEARFSSVVVMSKRAEPDRLASAAGLQGEPPSLDDVTRSVVSAIVAPTQPAAVQPPPTSAAAASTPGPSARPAAGLHRVFEGTVIDSVLLNRLDGSGIAPTNVLVTNDVFAQDGTRVIPAGARVVGATTAVSSFGAQRLAVAFHRVILPNGDDIPLDRFIGLNQIGDAGLRDQVNNHMLSTFGISAAIGLIGGLSQAVGNIGRGNGGTVVLGGATDTTAQSVAQVMQQFLNRPPHITIREGHRVKVYLTSDLDLSEY